MSTETAEHFEPSVTKPADTDPHVHSHEEEVKHAWAHFRENYRFFACFLALILLAVANFEFSSTNNYWVILGLAMARFALIGYFMFSLVRPFSLVIATFVFTVFFFGGMVWLSLWDSEIKPGVIGDPIRLPTHMEQKH